MVKLGEFLRKLQNTPDGDDTLLDHSLVYFGSGMSNGNQHDRNSSPALLVGGAHGRMRGNQHIRADNELEQPVADLLVSMAKVAGAEVEVIGPSTGTIDLA